MNALEKEPGRQQAFDRPVAIVLLAAAAAHVPVIGPHLQEAPYVGISFIAFSVSAVLLAAALMLRGRRVLLRAAVALCLAAVAAYAATRLIAFPLLADDVGNWTEPSGMAAVLSELVAAGLALCGLQSRSRGTVALRWPAAGMTGVIAGGTAMLVGVAPSAVALGPMQMRAQLVAAGATSCPAAVASPNLSEFTEQLTVPPRIDLRAGGSTSLTMHSGVHVFHAGLPGTSVFGYAAPGQTGADVYGGPTIEAMKGRVANVAVTNSLGAHPLAAYMDQTFMGMTPTDAAEPRAVLHLHGAHSEPGQDGLPADSFGHGQTNTYRYLNDQDSAGLWYHDHSWGMTRLQVTTGLAGQYWLRDSYDTGAASNPLGLPTGAAELPLTLQDKTFNADGSFAYPVGAFCGTTNPAGYPNQWAPESFGDVATVNGKVTPNLNVKRGVYRFRLLDASNARFYHLTMPAGAPVYQIGSDGGLLDAPVRLTSLLLAPAERADLLVDFRDVAPGTTFKIVNDAVAPYPSAPPAAADGGSPLPDIMQFTVTSGTGFQGDIPNRLRGGPGRPAVLPTLRPTTVRNIMLNEIADPTLDEPVRGHINNQGYADSTGMHSRTTQIESPKLNSVEEWDIVNTTGDAHPIHIHLTQFRVLNRQAFDEPSYTAAANSVLGLPGLPDPAASGNGPWPALSAARYVLGATTAPAANERGWKDTVVAPPGQITRIIVPFGGTAAGIAAPFVGDGKSATVQRFAGTYVFHCHILEHEDNDMMQPYAVTR